MKALKAQQASEVHLASALSAVEPMDTSLTDDFQVSRSSDQQNHFLLLLFEFSLNESGTANV